MIDLWHFECIWMERKLSKKVAFLNISNSDVPWGKRMWNICLLLQSLPPLVTGDGWRQNLVPLSWELKPSNSNWWEIYWRVMIVIQNIFYRIECANCFFLAAYFWMVSFFCDIVTYTRHLFLRLFEICEWLNLWDLYECHFI